MNILISTSSDGSSHAVTRYFSTSIFKIDTKVLMFICYDILSIHHETVICFLICVLTQSYRFLGPL